MFFPLEDRLEYWFLAGNGVGWLRLRIKERELRITNDECGNHGYGCITQNEIC